MAARTQGMAQVERQAKMLVAVDSIPLVFEINGRNRSLGSQ